MWHHCRTGRGVLAVPHTSVEIVVETRNVTCVEPGASHALGVRSSLPRPFQNNPTCVSCVGSCVRNTRIAIVNAGFTGGSAGSASSRITSANVPPRASVPSTTSVFSVLFSCTSLVPTQGFGASSRDTVFTVGFTTHVGETASPLADAGSMPSTSAAASAARAMPPARRDAPPSRPARTMSASEEARRLRNSDF